MARKGPGRRRAARSRARHPHFAPILPAAPRRSPAPEPPLPMRRVQRETHAVSTPLLRSFLFTTPLHPLLYGKKERSGG